MKQLEEGKFFSFMNGCIISMGGWMGVLMGEWMKNLPYAFRFLMEKGVFTTATLLYSFGKEMYLIKSANHTLIWRCTRRICGGNESSSTKNKSFFYGHRVPLHLVLLVILLFLRGVKQLAIAEYTELNPYTVRSIIGDIYLLMEGDLKMKDMRIGGKGIKVQVDESKFGKRKHHVGLKVDGVWFLVVLKRPTKERFLWQQSQLEMLPCLNRFQKPILNLVALFLLMAELLIKLRSAVAKLSTLNGEPL
ncbi:hypothetical protein BJV82DRAFT_636988 [Fennellomyces sp. T-0311]|nr:hypothetical protein BJV82DRAFT_636988 [Fennellomyces sp. T-0311]